MSGFVRRGFSGTVWSEVRATATACHNHSGDADADADAMPAFCGRIASPDAVAGLLPATLGF